jgi:hypothetical protein
MMRLARAALVTAGLALGGWWAGHMLFGIVFEWLRARDLETALDSPRTLALFEYAGTGLGLAFGAGAVWRWVWPRRARPIWAIYLLAAIGGLGGFAMAQIVDIGGLAIDFLRVGKDAYILISILSWFVLLIAGCVAVVADQTRGRHLAERIAHGAGVSVLALALLFAGFLATKGTWDTARNLGDTSSGWANIRFPPGSETLPDVKSIRAEMRTPLGIERVHPNEWRHEDGRPVLAVMIDFKLRTRERLLVLTLPDRAPLVFKPPFPAKPAVKFGYGPWLRIDGFLNEDGSMRPATERDDYAIRYMVTR